MREIDFLLQKSQHSHVTGAQLDVIFSIMMTIEIGSENQKIADLLKFIKLLNILLLQEARHVITFENFSSKCKSHKPKFLLLVLITVNLMHAEVARIIIFRS